MKMKAQQMTFRQDITKYKIYWLTFRCIIHNIFRAIKLIYKRIYIYIYIYVYIYIYIQIVSNGYSIQICE